MKHQCLPMPANGKHLWGETVTAMVQSKGTLPYPRPRTRSMARSHHRRRPSGLSETTVLGAAPQRTHAAPPAPPTAQLATCHTLTHPVGQTHMCALHASAPTTAQLATCRTPNKPCRAINTSHAVSV